MYTGLVIIAFLFYAITYKGKRNTYLYQHRDNVYLIVFFFSAALIMGLRGINVGVDTRSYSLHFDTISHSSWGQIFSNLNSLKYDSLEIGYVCLAKICSYIVNNYFFYQFVLACIYCFSMMFFFKENVRSKIVLSTVFLGCGLYLSAFNINRQMLAVTFTMLSWNCLCKHKDFKAILLLALATTFHTTAIIFLFAYFIFIIRRRKILLSITIIAAIFTAINYRMLINIVSEINGYKRYATNSDIIQTIGLSAVIFLIITIQSIYIFIEKNRFTTTDSVYAVFCIIYVICNIVGLYFNYFERLGFYFLPFVIVEIDTVAQKIESKNLFQLYTTGVSICYSAFFLLSSTTEQYIYSFFWDI